MTLLSNYVHVVDTLALLVFSFKWKSRSNQLVERRAGDEKEQERWNKKGRRQKKNSSSIENGTERKMCDTKTEHLVRSTFIMYFILLYFFAGAMLYHRPTPALVDVRNIFYYYDKFWHSVLYSLRGKFIILLHWHRRANEWRKKRSGHRARGRERERQRAIVQLHNPVHSIPKSTSVCDTRLLLPASIFPVFLFLPWVAVRTVQAMAGGK